jgi:signal transduction histidine kinase
LIALQQTTLDVSTQKEIAGLLQSIVERATRVLDVTEGWFFRAKGEEERPTLAASHSLDEDHVDAALRRGKGLAGLPFCGWALTQHQPVVVQARDPDADPAALEWMQKEDVQSLLMVPAVAQDDAIGLLGVIQVQEAREFSANEIALCQAFANLAAAALQNASLHESARQAEEAKSEFIDFVAHELKQPMTSMQGYAKMLTMGIGGELNDTQSQFVEVINANVDRMGRLVNNLLEISRLEAGRTKLKLAPVQLKEVVEEVIAIAGTEIEARHHTLEVDAPDDLPLALGDRERLAQILTNLVSNAYRYTPDGGTIRIALSGKGRPGVPPGHLCVSVSDSGIGLSPENLVKLKERFHRGEHDLVQQQPGTGLGVSITRGLVELHGGEFLIQSEPDQGSTFSFTVPIADTNDE